MMNKYAVLIGNSQFPDEKDKSRLPDLNCPPRDVVDLKTTLIHCKDGFLAENVLDLIDKTNSHIIETIESVFQRAAIDDLILIYYSGHGILAGLSRKLFLAAFNTVCDKLVSTAISISSLRDIMDIKTSHKKVILILDCCYSGDAGKNFSFRGNADAELDKELDESGKGIYLLTAAGSTVAIEQEKYGLFTKYLLEGLETGQADMDDDGYIDVKELFEYIAPRVTRENPKQEPRKYGFAETGKLFIAKSGRDSEKERLKKLKDYFHDLAKEERITTDILKEVLNLLKTSLADFSLSEQQQYALVLELFENKIVPVEFVTKWVKLAFEIEKIAHQKVTQEKLTREKEAQEKATQEKLAREKAAQVQDLPGFKNLEGLGGTAEHPKKWKKYLAWISVAVVVAFFLYPFLKQLMEETHSVVNVVTIPAPSAADTVVAPAKDIVVTTADTVVVPAAATPEKKVFEPEMVAITGGCFQMGSLASEPERSDDEKQHQVCVENFEMGKYEVTQAQWQAVMGNNPSYFKGDSLPVEQVNWDDVQSFIEKLNAKTGKTYRLPTEAQWEYAARAGTTTPFYTGNCININQANYDGNYDYNSCGAKTDVYKKQTVEVGSYPANKFELYDMAGNVWEWTCSAYIENYDGSETKCYSKNDTKTLRAIRGGSWDSGPSRLRSAARNDFTPGDRVVTLGLRLSRM